MCNTRKPAISKRLLNRHTAKTFPDRNTQHIHIHFRMCERACIRVCVRAGVCGRVCVLSSTLVYRSITWASECAISPASPPCSPRRLILPGGTAVMWEADEGGWKGGEGRCGGYTHYLPESSSNRTAAASSISSLLTSTSNIWFR